MNVGHRVLIVDDHPSFRATARVLLEAEGFEVVGEAADGAPGSEARRLHPDVVLLDVQFPDMDGFEVAAKLTRRRRPDRILISSRDSSDSARSCPEARVASSPRPSSRDSASRSSCSGAEVLGAGTAARVGRRWLAGLIAGAIAVMMVVSSDHEDEPGLVIVFGLATSWSFIGTGLYAWWRRPTNRFGALMTTVGFTSLIGVLTESNDSLVFTVGLLFGSVYLAVFVHMILAYPGGNVPTRGQRRLVAAVYSVAAVALLPTLLFASSEQLGCEGCRGSGSTCRTGETCSILDGLVTVVVVALVVAVLVVLVRRRRAATPPQRRAMAPVLWSGVVLLDLLGASLIAASIGIDPLENVLSLLGSLALLVLPWAYLFGLLQSRVSRAGAVDDLLRRIGEAPGTGRLQDLLADALGDPSLELVYHLEDENCWVDGEGRQAVVLPEDGDPQRAATSVELEGSAVGAILHDPSLCEDPDAMSSLASAAALAVGHERLQAQLRARVEQLRTSRARIVEAGTPSGGGSSATCTTAPSSGSSRSR